MGSKYFCIRNKLSKYYHISGTLAHTKVHGPSGGVFLFALCCHACPCAVPNHPWLRPISVGVLRQSWPCQGRELPTAGRKNTANGWLDQSRPNPRSNVWPCCLSNRPYSTCNAKGCPAKVCAFCVRAMHQPCCHSNSHRLENRNS